MKEPWGMHSDVGTSKLKSNKSDSAKKKSTFLDYFFFLSILEAGAFAFILSLTAV